MFRFIIVLVLRFRGSLVTKSVSLNQSSCTARPTSIDLNPDELFYYSLTFSQDKCAWSWNTIETHIK